MIRFLKARAIAGLEVVTNETYSRVIELGDVDRLDSCRSCAGAFCLRVIVRFPRLTVVAAIIARIRRMFDLERRTGGDCIARFRPIRSGAAGCGAPGPARAGRLGRLRDRRARGARPADYGQGGDAARQPHRCGARDTGRWHRRAGTDACLSTAGAFKFKTLAGLGMPSAARHAIAGIAAAARGRSAAVRSPPRSGRSGRALARIAAASASGRRSTSPCARLGESDAFLAGDVAVQRRLDLNGRRPTSRNCCIAPSAGGRGARTPCCICGWPTRTRKKFH